MFYTFLNIPPFNHNHLLAIHSPSLLILQEVKSFNSVTTTTTTTYYYYYYYDCS